MYPVADAPELLGVDVEQLLRRGYLLAADKAGRLEAGLARQSMSAE